MPSVKEVQLVCTPEEWQVLTTMTSVLNFTGPHGQSLKDKISAINKRLVFASSIPEDDEPYPRSSQDRERFDPTR